MSFISKRPLEVFVLETVVCLVYKAQAAQTHVTRKECKVIYLLQVTRDLSARRAGVAFKATVENKRLCMRNKILRSSNAK